MFLSTIIGLSLSIVAFSTLVAGDASTIITLNKVDVINKDNEFFGPWAVEIGKGKRSSVLTVDMPIKKELPDTMLLKLILVMSGQDPIEYESTLCECLEDDSIGKSYIEAGLPKDKFPKECPFPAGDFIASKWDPPKDMIPSGVPDGPITGSIMIMEEGKEPYVQLNFEGELSRAPPGMRR